MRRLIAITTMLAALFVAAPAFAVVHEVGDFADAPFPTASCPADCNAIAKVTGYQTRTAAHSDPMKVTEAGKIVAFTIKLGKPDADQMTFFQRLFGQRSQARISVLRRGAHKTARLIAQSPVFDLNKYFGSTPTFALDTPIKVPLATRKGSSTVIALTVPTWAPAFAVNLGRDHSWRSSRKPTACNDVGQPAVQDVIRSLRTYACFYRTARLLYSVTFVPNPKETNPEPKTRAAR
jgi:hypothetical protein